MASGIEQEMYMIQDWQKGDYLISTDPQRLDMATIHGFLTTAYWSEGIPRETVQRCIDHSLNFGLYKHEQQIGFARVVTDYTSFGYLCDVFVLIPFRGHGLGTWLIETIVAHSELQGIRQWMLLTRDAHHLYEKVGFTPSRSPERYMELRFPNIYKAQEDTTSR